MKLIELLCEKTTTTGMYQIFDTVVPYVVALLKNAGVPAENKFKKSAGTVRHVRLDIADAAEVFKSIGITLTPLIGTKIATGSPTFTTYSAEFDKPMGGFPKGTMVYVVNRLSVKGRVTGDMLTPSAMGFDDAPRTPAQVEAHVAKFLPTIGKFTPPEIQYLLSMLQLGTDAKSSLTAPETLTAHELNKIAITYGEIVGAVWFAKQQPGQKIIFPSGNNALIDFVVRAKDGAEELVSAKVGKGAPPSSAAIFAKIDEDREYFESKYGKKAVSVLHAINELSVVDGVLEAHRLLDTPSYRTVQKISGGIDFTAKGLEGWLRNPKFVDAESLRVALEPFYKVNISRSETSAFDDIVAADTRRLGLVSTPLGYNLTKLLNDTDKYPEFTEILNDVTSRINVTQLYTNLTPKGIEFVIKPFSSGKFVWEFNATGRDPYKKKMSFRMK